MAKKITYATIYKVDEAKRLVYGVATEETPDHENEIFDYDTSKTYFEEWSKNAEKVTGGKSKGNIRYMHQLDAVGKVVELFFDDAHKRINVGAKIVDDAVWNKVVEGVLTGFSIGGRAIRRWKDKANSAYTRFTVQPSEISVVDLPCCPTAVFEYCKADGSVESRKFQVKESNMDLSDFGQKLDRVWAEVQGLKKASGVKTRKIGNDELEIKSFAFVGNPEDPTTWLIPMDAVKADGDATAQAVINLAKKISDKESLKSVITEVAKEKGFVEKSMGSICDLVYAIQQLYWVRMDAEWEAVYEGEGGDPRDAMVAAKLRVLIGDAVQILKDIVDEETAEMSAELKTDTPEVAKKGPECKEDMKDKEEEGEDEEEEADEDKDKSAPTDPPPTPEVTKTDDSAAGSGQEGETMNKEDVLKAIQDAIAALDLKKAVADAITELNVPKIVADAVGAEVPKAITAVDVPKLVGEEVGKAVTAAAPKEPAPVFAVPRVQKGDDWKKVTSDEDCGL